MPQRARFAVVKGHSHTSFGNQNRDDAGLASAAPSGAGAEWLEVAVAEDAAERDAIV